MKCAPSQAYAITYSSSKQEDLDSDFVLVYIEAHSHADAMTIVNNIERFFDGVTVTCEPIEPEKKRLRKRRREQRAKTVRNR